jgi:penicillin-insensitive murein endopeptidase
MMLRLASIAILTALALASGGDFALARKRDGEPAKPAAKSAEVRKSAAKKKSAEAQKSAKKSAEAKKSADAEKSADTNAEPALPSPVDIFKTEPAKKLFAEKELPSIGKAAAIGYYPKGCLQGGVELPPTGATWQVMRISRNRNWGHPALVKFLERFAPLAAKATGWRGVLVGDMAQPRGGPLPYGHSSHQIGLDVDLWFAPMPETVLTKEERDSMPFTNLVADDWKRINPKTWTPAHATFIRTAAQQPEVERVLVNAAIKKELCAMQGDKHPDWMSKVRPWYGHHDHIHVRLKCPADSPSCRKQDPVREGPECAEKDLKFWFSDKVLHPPEPPKPVADTADRKPDTADKDKKADAAGKGKDKKTADADKAKKKKKPHVLTLADLPPACKDVLQAPARTILTTKAN